MSHQQLITRSVGAGNEPQEKRHKPTVPEVATIEILMLDCL